MRTILSVQDYSGEEAIAAKRASKPACKENMLEQYEFLELLGEGSFAKVFKCIEKQTKRVFAAKELEFNDDSNNKAQIKHEIEILQGLRHENIVSLHTSFSVESSFYLIMEFVDGGSLFDEVIGEAVFSEKQACRLIKQVRISPLILNRKKVYRLIFLI